MQLKNPFSEETRLLYLYRYSCSDYGRSDRGLELHHIRGRISDSPWNACLVCHHCHAEYNHNQEEEQRLFLLNLQFLKSIEYKPIQKDLDFLKDNFERLNTNELQQWLSK